MTVAGWVAWRQDDNGNRYRIGSFGDRVDALARTLELEAGVPHKQLYWVAGPPGPVVGDRADLRARGMAAAAGRAVPAYRMALVVVGRVVAGLPVLDLDTAAAVLVAAARIATGTGPTAGDRDPTTGEDRDAAGWLADATAGWAGTDAVTWAEFERLTGVSRAR
ncbi:hypothetical protein R8Z50_09130 [Longispora sp. K20-0274]|uniref:hypothetical protein n=1 Tax=Longispora sp. K20-0274 TaxID=3088255 RepID=UPI00399A5A88